MASFDITSKIDTQKLDNAINVVKKELSTRYDLKEAQVELELDKKDLILNLETSNPMAITSVEDIILTRSIKQGIDGRSFDFSKDEVPSGKKFKKAISVRNGLSKEDCKTIQKHIKDSGVKVQAQIMDDIIRVTSKKIDDLQAVIAYLRQQDLEVPLQFVNMK
jgi:cyclic-di-GMP-binding protein